MLGENEKSKVLNIHCNNIISNVSTVLSFTPEINITKTAHSMTRIYVNFIKTCRNGREYAILEETTI